MSRELDGALRVGINLANPLLVSGRAEDGTPVGVAPSLGAALAAHLDVPHTFTTYAGAGQLAAGTDWDAAFLADDPARAAAIDFSPPYAEIEVRFLAHPGAHFADAKEVDRRGTTVVAEAGSAYELWLRANLRSARLERADGAEDARRRFADDPDAVLAGLAPALRRLTVAGLRAEFVPGRVTAVRQAVGVRVGRSEAAAAVAAFVRDALASGLIRDLTERFGVAGDLVIPR